VTQRNDWPDPFGLLRPHRWTPADVARLGTHLEQGLSRHLAGGVRHALAVYEHGAGHKQTPRPLQIGCQPLFDETKVGAHQSPKGETPGLPAYPNIIAVGV
jgi:hypothetical protein